MLRNIVRMAAVGAVVLPAAAIAAPGAVTADLNLRAGPGTNFQALDTVPNGAPVEIDGCVEGGNWCRVTYGNVSGYAAARYLTVTQGSRTVVVSEEPSLIGTIVGAPIKVVGGAVEAVGSAVTGVADATVDAFTPDDEVTVYVDQNPVEPAYVQGDVVVGTALPQDVRVYRVPNSDYEYTYVNGQRVIVEPGTRQVLYVYKG